MKLSLSQVLGTFVTFEGSTEITPGVVAFRFRPPASAPWEAGQYYVFLMPTDLLDPRSPLRPFSISSAPAERIMEITTRVVDHPSPFKQQLLQLKPGAPVYAAGPYGTFTLKDVPGSHIFLAGGIGVTPFRSMLVEASRTSRMPDITLLYSGRDAVLPFRDEFDELAAAHPGLTIKYITGAQKIDAATIRSAVPNLTEANFYISGPKPMVLGVDALLRDELGVSSKRISRDVFRGYPWPLS